MRVVVVVVVLWRRLHGGELEHPVTTFPIVALVDRMTPYPPCDETRMTVVLLLLLLLDVTTRVAAVAVLDSVVAAWSMMMRRLTVSLVAALHQFAEGVAFVGVVVRRLCR